MKTLNEIIEIAIEDLDKTFDNYTRGDMSADEIISALNFLRDGKAMYEAGVMDEDEKSVVNAYNELNEKWHMTYNQELNTYLYGETAEKWEKSSDQDISLFIDNKIKSRDYSESTEKEAELAALDMLISNKETFSTIQKYFENNNVYVVFFRGRLERVESSDNNEWLDNTISLLKYLQVKNMYNLYQLEQCVDIVCISNIQHFTDLEINKL